MVCARPLRRVFPGRPDQVRHARRFVARALGPGPVTETAVLLTSELAANAVQHTNTSRGGVFEVIACRRRLMAFVAVIDDGSDAVPAPRRADPGDLSESGHGLGLVELLATRWGHWRSHACLAPGDAVPDHAAPQASPRRVVWFGLALTTQEHGLR
jgi:anti-sigma regulatory factor (Ser/Thr protein kinase)